jgi:hypothetical protein
MSIVPRGSVSSPSTTRPGRDPGPEPTSRGALIVAALVLFVVNAFVPFGGVLLYPLTLLSTWVHEMGHGLTALALGGRFASLDVFVNGSGLAHTSIPDDWRNGLVAIGGLVAPPTAGAVLLAVSRGPRRARVLLAGLALAVVVSLALDTWTGKGYLFTDSAFVDGELRRSDTATVAHAFGGTYLVWGVLVLGVSLALLALGFRFAWRR